MKLIAALYSLLFAGVALWTWATYFSYENSMREHLLPAIALNIVSLPSSLIVEKLAAMFPWILNSPIMLLSIVTGLGALQAIFLWVFAAWRNSPNA